MSELEKLVNTLKLNGYSVLRSRDKGVNDKPEIHIAYEANCLGLWSQSSMSTQERLDDNKTLKHIRLNNCWVSWVEPIVERCH